MNKLQITPTPPKTNPPETFQILLSQSSSILPILRDGHFIECCIELPNKISNEQLRFCMHLKRILHQDGRIVFIGGQEDLGKVRGVGRGLGLVEKGEGEGQVVFVKRVKVVQQVKEEHKLAIGFKSQVEEQVDEDELLQNEQIDLSKPEKTSCEQKIRACANCNCGRKQAEQLSTQCRSALSKEELINSVNEGKSVSGCGKCYLGDSFRCATCPYKGLPAFKPGDKLKLVDQSQVVVESAAVSVTNGKVKIEL